MDRSRVSCLEKPNPMIIMPAYCCDGVSASRGLDRRQGTHRDDPIVGDIGGELEEHQKPSVGVVEGFDNLFLLPLVALDAGQVVLDPDHSLCTLLGRQEPRIEQRVGEEEEAERRKRDSAAAEDKEKRLRSVRVLVNHDSPRCDMEYFWQRTFQEGIESMKPSP